MTSSFAHPVTAIETVGPRPGKRNCRELFGIDAVGVALHRDLGVVGAVDRVEDPHQLRGVDERWRTAPEEHACRRRVLLGAPAPDVDNTRVDIGIDEVPAISPRREVAIVTPRRAEGNMNVDSERHALRLRRLVRWGFGRT